MVYFIEEKSIIVCAYHAKKKNDAIKSILKYSIYKYNRKKTC